LGIFAKAVEKKKRELKKRKEINTTIHAAKLQETGMVYCRLTDTNH
jgi:hypothetical protein